MSKYTLTDGTIVNTETALNKWEEDSDWDGNNHISRATGSQWEHQALYRSSKGRYWIESWSQWQGSLPHAFLVSEEDAARWLLQNNYDLPEDLQEHGAAICE